MDIFSIFRGGLKYIYNKYKNIWITDAAVVAKLYSRTQLIAVFDKANVLELRLRVRLIGNENR